MYTPVYTWNYNLFSNIKIWGFYLELQPTNMWFKLVMYVQDVTGLALTSVNKFLACNMIDESKRNVTSAVENLADTVTHSRCSPHYGKDY